MFAPYRKASNKQKEWIIYGIISIFFHGLFFIPFSLSKPQDPSFYVKSGVNSLRIQINKASAQKRKKHQKKTGYKNAQGSNQKQSASFNSSSGAISNTKLKYKVNPPPEYPLAALRENIQGVVVLRIYLNIHGFVKKVQVVKSSGYYLLDEAAKKAVLQWQAHTQGQKNFTARSFQQQIEFRINEEDY